MSNRYEAYTRLKLDYPSKRFFASHSTGPKPTIRSTPRPIPSSPISGAISTTILISTRSLSPGPARRFRPAAILN